MHSVHSSHLPDITQPHSEHSNNSSPQLSHLSETELIILSHEGHIIAFLFFIISNFFFPNKYKIEKIDYGIRRTVFRRKTF